MAEVSEKQKQAQTLPVNRRSFWSRFGATNVIIPFLFCVTIFVAIVISMQEGSRSEPKYIKYTSVTGYFHQDDPDTEWKTFDYTDNFGLIDPDWPKFANIVSELNKHANSQTRYKVLFLGRHGEGYHNVAEAYYGTEAWDCYYSLLDGNGTSSWADAHLTPKGIGQAELAASVWSKALAAGLPVPQSFYSSPLTRCMQTAYHTFSSLISTRDSTTSPIFSTVEIRELLRETIGVHTCDRRSTKSQIKEFWKSEKLKGRDLKFVFEDDFAEQDKLWDKEMRELPAGEDRRSEQAMDRLFDFKSGDKETWISISGHSGIIGSLLRVLGHREFRLSTGGVIPVLVKAELVSGERPPIQGDSWEKIVPCKDPPKPASQGKQGLAQDPSKT